MELVVGSLMMHRQVQHGVVQRDQGQPQTPRGVPDLPGIFPGGADTPHIPSGGITGGSNQTDQPPVPLCATSRAGLHCDPGGGQPSLPPLP